jgi:predicted O-methyltransferase YrrM
MESWMSDLGLQKSIADSRVAIKPSYSLSASMENNRPYFGRQLSAFQSPPVRYALMADLARYVFRGKARVRVLEVGSWAGASAITFGRVIRELGISDGKIICIDQWEMNFVAEDSALHYKSMNAATMTGEIQKLFEHNVKVCGLGEMVQVMKASAREALPQLKDVDFDLVYIDGSHKKDDVLYDLQQAKRLVRSGGVICGDDLELLKSQVDSNAHQVVLQKDTDFVVDPRTGVRYHPGVTESIAVMFDGVWQEQGLWCVQCSGEEWNIPAFPVSNLEIPTHLQHAVEIPYGQFNGYELFQLGDEFVAYPMTSPY